MTHTPELHDDKASTSAQPDTVQPDPVQPDEAPDVRTIVQRAVIGYVVLAGGLALLGLIGDAVIFDSVIGGTDLDIVEWIADHRVGWLDSVASIGSTFSDTWTVLGVLVGACTMLWATGHARHATTIALAVLLEFTTFLAVGAIVGRARPDVETLNSVPSTPSFPSGHAAAAFVLYGALVLVGRSISPERIPRIAWVVPCAVGIVVACSRVYEGVHHPIDVIAGLLLGVGALLVAAFATGLRDRPGWAAPKISEFAA